MVMTPRGRPQSSPKEQALLAEVGSIRGAIWAPRAIFSDAQTCALLHKSHKLRLSYRMVQSREGPAAQARRSITSRSGPTQHSLHGPKPRPAPSCTKVISCDFHTGWRKAEWGLSRQNEAALLAEVGQHSIAWPAGGSESAPRRGPNSL